MTDYATANPDVRCALGRVPELVKALLRLGVRPDDLVADRTAPECREIGVRMRGCGLVIDVALSDDARRRLKLEVIGRRWAGRGGVWSPEVLAEAPDNSWMIGRAVENVYRRGPAFVEAAMKTAAAISELPPETSLIAATSWRAPRRSLPLRLGRLIRCGISPATFWSAKRAATQFGENEVSVHGDFQTTNVLFDAATGRSAVVDWEFRGVGRRYSDATRFLATVRCPEDAAHGLEHLLQTTPVSDTPRVMAELRWQALRALGAEATRPAYLREEAQLRAFRSRYLWARSAGAHLLRSTRSTSLLDGCN